MITQAIRGEGRGRGGTPAAEARLSPHPHGNRPGVSRPSDIVPAMDIARILNATAYHLYSLYYMQGRSMFGGNEERAVTFATGGATNYLIDCGLPARAAMELAGRIAQHQANPEPDF